MSLDSDIIVDRRRIRRKLTFWRVMAALIAIAAIAGFALVATPGARGTFASAGSIARVQIEGLIRSDSDRTQALERLQNSPAAAVLLHINLAGRPHRRLRAALRLACPAQGEEAARRRGRGSRCLRRLHHGDCQRSYHRPT